MRRPGLSIIVMIADGETEAEETVIVMEMMTMVIKKMLST